MKHRTYLWVYLVFDHLRKEDFKKTQSGVSSAIETLSKSITQAYEQILSKSRHPVMVRKALTIILAANRPLKLAEMNVAVNITERTQSFSDIDPEEEEDFKIRLRSWCGLFVSICGGKIYFLHQTAREFLLKELSTSSAPLAGSQWYHSIDVRQAHAELAELCVRFLCLFGSNTSLLEYAAQKITDRIEFHALTNYSATFWSSHFREALIDCKNVDIVNLSTELCDPTSEIYSVWFPVYCQATYAIDPEFGASLGVASFLGLSAVAESLLQKGANLECKDVTHGQTPLLWAISCGYNEVAELLLQNGADANVQGGRYGTALGAAACMGNKEMVELLLEKGANVNVQGGDYGTALGAAAYGGNKEIVELLLEKGADINVQGGDFGTALGAAACMGRKEIVQLLLKNGVDWTIANKDGWTPLNSASGNGYLEVVKLLLEKGADWTIATKDGWTPLNSASSNGRLEVVKLLLEEEADLSVTSNSGWTPLASAASNDHAEVVKLLLEKGAYRTTNGIDPIYGTIINLIAFKGYTNLLHFTIEHNNADLKQIDIHKRTTLQCAARGGHIETFKYLISQGLEPTTLDAKGDDMASFAASGGSLKVLSLVLEQQSISASRPGYWSPLHWACRAGKPKGVELLIARGWESQCVTVAELQGNWTPLAIAIFHGHKNMIAKLSETCQAALNTGNMSLSTTGVSHGGAWCNGCFHDIYGPRFHCRTCVNLDYCFMCKSLLEHLHEDHGWERVERFDPDYKSS